MSYEKVMPNIDKEKIAGFMNKDRLVVHCGTKREAIHLFNYLSNEGIKWCNGARLDIKETRFDFYGSRTCYCNHDSEHGIMYSDLAYYHEEHNYPVIEFKDLLED